MRRNVRPCGGCWMEINGIWLIVAMCFELTESVAIKRLSHQILASGVDKFQI